ncbi:glycerol kinase-like isoform X2 [Varroa destructor]|uniref:Probable glycerol kinase n=1 Tax=Varroa destructor TaxID=109461 RepID=A0A7M7JIA8_VARDE|nr:glycerol kinase-like isoform X2 [Varroa destructor]
MFCGLAVVKTHNWWGNELFRTKSIFSSRTSELIAYHQVEVAQIYPKEGWVEEDPMHILQTVTICMTEVWGKLIAMQIDPHDVVAIGMTNQRESTIIWDKNTGKPYYNAILWCDNRTVDTVEALLEKVPERDPNYLRPKCGLPLSTYFSAVKLAWLFTHHPELGAKAEQGSLIFGTVDSWLLWNLIGGVHVTDVSNASRTMLMDIETLEWDPFLLNFFKIPKNILPKILSSSEIYGTLREKTPFAGVPISGCLGDQSAALVGHMCFNIGETKCTYGTGGFLLCNTGSERVMSTHGLLTTVAFKLGPSSPACYAIEGSVAVAGSAVRWLRDNLGIVQSIDEVQRLALSVKSTHDVYFVPAFSGLYAPYWESSARGVICGLTQFTTKEHLVRATLESVCYQVKEIIDCVYADTRVELKQLLVDGGMAHNDALMQLQANILGVNVIRPQMLETTALGAAVAAGLAKGVEVWSLDEMQKLAAAVSDTFEPQIVKQEREMKFSRWKQAVERSRHWEDPNVTARRKQVMGDQWYRVSALPMGVFLMSAFGIVILASYRSLPTS